MKNNIKKTFEAIHAAHGKMTTLADQVAKAEAQVVLAQQKTDQANFDNGTLPAAEIYDRTEAARKELGIRTIEANRAAAKLTECEDELREVLSEAYPEFLSILSTKASEARETTAAKLKLIVGEWAATGSEFQKILAMAEPVTRPLALQNRLSEATYNPDGEPNYLNPALLSALFEAEKLL